MNSDGELTVNKKVINNNLRPHEYSRVQSATCLASHYMQFIDSGLLEQVEKFTKRVGAEYVWYRIER